MALLWLEILHFDCLGNWSLLCLEILCAHWLSGHVAFVVTGNTVFWLVGLLDLLGGGIMGPLIFIYIHINTRQNRSVALCFSSHMTKNTEFSLWRPWTLLPSGPHRPYNYLNRSTIQTPWDSLGYLPFMSRTTYFYLIPNSTSFSSTTNSDSWYLGTIVCIPFKANFAFKIQNENNTQTNKPQGNLNTNGS